MAAARPRKSYCFNGRGAGAGKLQGAKMPVKLPPVAKARYDWTPAMANQGLLPWLNRLFNNRTSI
ncbi:hypothetical protein ACSS6W_006487 [Trichoderma asperelloides]